MSGIQSKPARAPGNADRQMGDHRRVLDELARTPILNSATIEVTLPNGVTVTTQHGLGRSFENLVHSPPQGAAAAGYIKETVTDKSREFVLTANGYGATVTVRVTIW